MSCAGVSAKASYPQQMYPADCNRRQHQPFNWRGDPGGKDIIFVDGHKYEWVLKFERSCVLKDYPVISIHNCSSICQRHMFDVCVCVCVRETKHQQFAIFFLLSRSIFPLCLCCLCVLHTRVLSLMSCSGIVSLQDLISN